MPRYRHLLLFLCRHVTVKEYLVRYGLGDTQGERRGKEKLSVCVRVETVTTYYGVELCSDTLTTQKLVNECEMNVHIRN